MTPAIDKDAIWLAGFIDGEGAVMVTKGIRHDSRSNNPQYQIRVAIVNTELSALEHIKSIFGGSIHSGHGTFKKSVLAIKHFKPVYEWIVTDKTAYQVLERVKPYLIIKNERAEVVMEYHISRAKWRAGRGVNNKLDENELQRRESIYQKMKKLNLKGLPQEG